MSKEELIRKLDFIQHEKDAKHLNIYVTADGELQLFNIDQKDLDELLPLYVEFLTEGVINNKDLDLGKYSISTSRENMIYQYDLDENTRTQEMKYMAFAGTETNPKYFVCDESSLENIDGLYAVINDEENRIVMYKQIIPVEKTYGCKSYLFGCKHDKSQFERKRYSMIRITPGMQMLYVDGDIILVEMNKLEKTLGLNAILQKESEATFQCVYEKDMIQDINKLKEACEKPSLLKKLRHALTESKTKIMSKEDILKYAKTQKKLKFKFNSDMSMFILDSRAAAERFIKLLDDDYLYSQMTNTEYDSAQKSVLGEIVE